MIDLSRMTWVKEKFAIGQLYYITLSAFWLKQTWLFRRSLPNHPWFCLTVSTNNNSGSGGSGSGGGGGGSEWYWWCWWWWSSSLHAPMYQSWPQSQAEFHPVFSWKWLVFLIPGLASLSWATQAEWLRIYFHTKRFSIYNLHTSSRNISRSQKVAIIFKISLKTKKIKSLIKNKKTVKCGICGTELD